MGYALNVGLSIPMAVIIYLLTEKLIIKLTGDNKFEDRIQKGFIIGFVAGLVFIFVGMTVFGHESNIANESLRYAMHGSGSFLILNSIIFNWHVLDEGTKIIILLILLSSLLLFSYTYKNNVQFFRSILNDKEIIDNTDHNNNDETYDANDNDNDNDNDDDNDNDN
jgi:hypothetical protein